MGRRDRALVLSEDEREELRNQTRQASFASPVHRWVCSSRRLWSRVARIRPVNGPTTIAHGATAPVILTGSAKPTKREAP